MEDVTLVLTLSVKLAMCSISATRVPLHYQHLNHQAQPVVELVLRALKTAGAVQPMVAGFAIATNVEERRRTTQPLKLAGPALLLRVHRA